MYNKYGSWKSLKFSYWAQKREETTNPIPQNYQVCKILRLQFLRRLQFRRVHFLNWTEKLSTELLFTPIYRGMKEDNFSTGLVLPYSRTISVFLGQVERDTYRREKGFYIFYSPKSKGKYVLYNSSTLCPAECWNVNKIFATSICLLYMSA